MSHSMNSSTVSVHNESQDSEGDDKNSYDGSNLFVCRKEAPTNIQNRESLRNTPVSSEKFIPSDTFRTAFESYMCWIVARDTTAEEDEMLKSIGSKAREWREKHFPDVSELAKAVNVSVQDVIDLEEGVLSLTKAREVFRKIMNTDMSITEIQLILANDDLRKSDQNEQEGGWRDLVLAGSGVC